MTDDIITASAPLPRLVSAEPRGERTIEVHFADGTKKIVDVAPVLASRRIYIPLRSDDTLFAAFKVGELGDAIEWPDGIDMSADWLAKLPGIGFGNDDFRNAMDQLGMTLDGMALALGVSRRLIARYRDDTAIPRAIAFATRYLCGDTVFRQSL